MSEEVRKYQRNGIIVEAGQWGVHNYFWIDKIGREAEDSEEICNECGCKMRGHAWFKYLLGTSLDGPIIERRICPWTWIIRTANGCIFPLDAETFAKEFDEVPN